MGFSYNPFTTCLHCGILFLANNRTAKNKYCANCKIVRSRIVARAHQKRKREEGNASR